MKFIKIYYIFLLNVLTTLVWSQDPAGELININKSFYKNEDVAMQVITKFFIDNSIKPNKESKTEIYKIPGSYLQKTANFESMVNENYKINIDFQKKVIVINSVNKGSENKKANTDLFEKENFKMSLDTVMSFYKKVVVKNINETTSEIIFSFKSGMYDFIKVTYDKKSYLVYEYYIKVNPTDANSKDSKKHEYTYIITNKYLDKKILTKKMFNESNYIVIKKQEITPSPNYNGYKLVNNILNNSKN